MLVTVVLVSVVHVADTIKCTNTHGCSGDRQTESIAKLQVVSSAFAAGVTQNLTVSIAIGNGNAPKLEGTNTTTTTSKVKYKRK